ncbi:MAG: alpha/beta hydrolase-fold protein [Verrucomicrobia bacterium]|nr:alpha/beta hydrolase-fold protein [Verrucomicrobiota bacterium]
MIKDIEFTYTLDVGSGNEICVSGVHPTLGGNDPLKAVKLAWSTGNVWRGKIALPAGESLTYHFIKRSFNVANWVNASLVTSLTGDLTVVVPDHVAPPWSGKTVFLHSNWTQAWIQYRDLTHGGNWVTVPMAVVGAGRTVSEKLFRVDGLLTSGAEMEFVFNNGSAWLNALAPPTGTASGAAPATPTPYQGLAGPYNFRTSLDVLFVQDQQVFNYKPPASLSAPSFLTRAIGSTVSGVPARPITIYFPRGYAENTWKKYPVLYFHDGQNVFFPGGTFGTWDADRIATYETSQGRMRECILVAIPNGNDYGSNRLNEYLPDSDTITNYGGTGTNYSGRASQYLSFIRNNIIPTLDYNYRTLTDTPNRLVAGSSLGGLVSDYISQFASDLFGGAGIFSPAYWAAPNYIGGRTVSSLALRRYLYMGTAESSTGEASSDVYWQGALSVYNSFLGAGHVAGRDLLFEGGASATHSEPYWSRRLPTFFGFALNPWLEGNSLALEYFTPTLSLTSLDVAGNKAHLRYLSLFGFRQVLQSTTDLSAWSGSAVADAVNPWDQSDVDASADSSPKKFWFLQIRLP